MRDIKAVQYSTFATTAADDGVAPPLVHPLDNAGLLSKLVFSWAGPLVALGNERQLALKDMWSLQPANKVAKISSTFKVAYNAKGKSVLGGFFSMYWVQFWCLGAMQLFSVVANLYGPGYVLGEIISIVQAPSFDTTYALQLIGSLLAIQIANVFVTAHMNFLDSVVSLQFMAAIRSMLFEKAMNLNAASRKVKSTGEITNLVSTDAARVMEFGLNAHQFWIVPIQVGCVLYLLYNLVGWSIFVGFGVVFAIVVVNAIVAVLLGSTQKEFSTLKDLRMKLVNELFGSIQVVKFNAWEEKFLASVRDLRATEVNAIWKFMRYLVFLLTFLRGAPTLVTISVFATFTLWMRQTLTITIVFSTLALFTALQDAIMTLPMVILNLVQALVSAKRIDEFLHLDERDDAVVMTPRTARAAADIYASDRAVVAIESGHFGWDDHTPFFKNINLKVRQGEFVVVHGAVGAGKSSLCSILLGEMHKTGGTVFVGGDVAYFSQQPWIQHTTVRENILFGRPYDRVKYQAVVDACALTADMASFPAGDRAEIGPKGLNLSGGQKARISLARACYSDADIYILDSPLSAVDAIVAKEIFSKCFLGLLKHKTVILVTHSPEIIESGDVDRLILIQDGQLVERATSGTAAQASSEPPLVAPLRPTKAYWDDESNLPVYLPVHREYDMLLTPSATTPYNFHASEMLFTQKVTLSGTHTFDDLGRLVVEEECREGRVSKSVANRYFNAMGGWLSVAVVVLTSVGAQGVQLATDLWLTHWSNQSGSMDPGAFAAATDANMIVYALLGCATCVAFAVQMSAMYGFGLVASQKLFDDMLTNLLQVPMQFFDTNPIGRILNRFSDDVMACDIMLANTFVTMVGMVLFIVSTAGTAIFIMQWYGLGVLPLLYVYVRLGAYYLSPLRDLNRLQKTTRSPVITLISEGIDGSVTIRAYGDKQLRRFYRLQQSNVETFCATMFAQTALRQWFTLRVQLISCAIVTLMLLTIVVLQGALSHGFVGLLVTRT
ncbi:hypothetical protein H310_05134 [Aphanomyces invadans]|uniref:ABC transmembrane type-1 domain-containing protein n=1 Tax=Aphanomyces invadans TaxID=157072 RepID=A0A024UDQ7_9STRA|nr:hypothetical protein H310_05134 [Aphanomyces invadans]ETW03768.1 hypothetical protein H310_05134 [Aphanomyces invadans]|eukprot:XP_008867997.1 hypothetical protein H310_05134 [Aphanomyces invadans]